MSVFAGDHEYFARHNPKEIVQRNDGYIRDNTLVRIMVGDADHMGSQVPGFTVIKANTEFHENLDRLKIPHEFIVAPGVGHTYGKLYTETGDSALEFFKKAFEKLNSKMTRE